jgi:hypothetical protein
MQSVYPYMLFWEKRASANMLKKTNYVDSSKPPKIISAARPCINVSKIKILLEPALGEFRMDLQALFSVYNGGGQMVENNNLRRTSLT